MPRLVAHPCRECKQLFTGLRALKYCSDKCREVVRKRQNREYERRVKRWPYKYRKNQLELPLDNVRTEPYKGAS